MNATGGLWHVLRLTETELVAAFRRAAVAWRQLGFPGTACDRWAADVERGDLAEVGGTRRAAAVTLLRTIRNINILAAESTRDDGGTPDEVRAVTAVVRAFILDEVPPLEVVTAVLPVGGPVAALALLMLERAT